MRIVGIDSSLTSTGVAVIEDGKLVHVESIKTKGKKGAKTEDYIARFDFIVGRLSEIAWAGTPQAALGVDLAVIEGLSYASTGMRDKLAGLWWGIASFVDAEYAPLAVVAPQARAKYITGSGRADKATVLAHAQHYYQRPDGPRIATHDEADAAGLAAIGSRYMGKVAELYEMDAVNLEALNKVEWPEGLERG